MFHFSWNHNGLLPCSQEPATSAYTKLSYMIFNRSFWIVSSQLYTPVSQMVSLFPFLKPIGVCITPLYHVSRNSVVWIATDYGLDCRGVGVRVPAGIRLFSSPQCPDRFCGPPNLLFSGYRRLFPPVSRIIGSIHPLPHTPSWSRA
jgi:hypothetical protein